MKTHNYSTCGAILLLVVSLFFSAFVAGQAMGADPRSPHAVAPSQAPARLVIRRMPNLGFNVIFRLWFVQAAALAPGIFRRVRKSSAPNSAGDRVNLKCCLHSSRRRRSAEVRE